MWKPPCSGSQRKSGSLSAICSQTTCFRSSASGPARPGTDLRAGLDYLNRVLRRRSLVFVFSDFLDQGYEKTLQRTAHRHDVVAVTVSDPRDQELPAVGFLEVQDAETGESILLDTSNPRFREAFRQRTRHA